MQSVYSWMGTPLHLVLEDDVATDYNRAQDAFIAAQERHLAIHGKRWDPITEPLQIDWTPQEAKAWDDIARVVNLLVEINGGGLDIPDEQITSDKMVKLA